MNAYHEQITELFDEYYEARTDVERRIAQADALIEEFIDKHGKRPPASVLSRLATYILLDTLTDSHPDKMTREEYPIMSRGQIGRRFEQSITKGDIFYGDMTHLGKRKVNAFMTDDSGEADEYDSSVSSIHLVGQDYTEMNEIDDRLSFTEIAAKAGLSERETIVIEELYEHNRTQSEIGELLSVDQSQISRAYNSALNKIREYLYGISHKKSS